MCIFCGGQCGGVGEFLISLGLPFLALYLSRIKGLLGKVKKFLFSGNSNSDQIQEKGTKYRYCGEWPAVRAKPDPLGLSSRSNRAVPLALAASKLNNSLKIREQKESTGVKGWLLLLCINLTIFIPAASLYEANCTLEIFNSVRNKILLSLFKGLLLYNVLLVVSMVFLTFSSFYAGLRLWKVRHNAVRTAKAFFITQLSLIVIITITRPMVDYPLGGHGLILSDLMKRLIPALLNFGLWYLYLSYSKRVSHTFRENKPHGACVRQPPPTLVGQTKST